MMMELHNLLLGFERGDLRSQRDLQQEQQSVMTMLNAAGPGYAVHSVTWRERSGAETTIRKAFPYGTSREELDAWKRSKGWPGHQGRPWDYFKDWLRSKLTLRSPSE